MGRGSSKIGGGGGAPGGGAIAGTGTRNAQETLSAFDTVVANESDPFDAVPQIKDIMDTSMVGTQFVMSNNNMLYEFTKAADGKWDVTMGRSRQDLIDNKPSHDSANMAAGEVVNCLYKLT